MISYIRKPAAPTANCPGPRHLEEAPTPTLSAVRGSPPVGFRPSANRMRITKRLRNQGGEMPLRQLKRDDQIHILRARSSTGLRGQ